MDADRSALVRRGTFASVAMLIVFLVAWEWGPGLLKIPPYIVPPLSATFNEFVRMWGVAALALSHRHYRL